MKGILLQGFQNLVGVYLHIYKIKKYKIEMKEVLLQGFQNLVGVYLFNTYKVKKRPCRKEDRLFEREFF